MDRPWAPFSGRAAIKFMGTFTSRFDAKGRTSVPAPFRTVLRALAVEGQPSLVLLPSHTHPCIEGFPTAEFDKLAARVEAFDLFSQEHDWLSAVMYSDSQSVEPDKEGRIGLADELVQHAGLSEQVMFMARGAYFQIWDAAAGAAYKAQARQEAMARRLTLPAAPR